MGETVLSEAAISIIKAVDLAVDIKQAIEWVIERTRATPRTIKRA
jgi:hypothetical protein